MVHLNKQYKVWVQFMKLYLKMKIWKWQLLLNKYIFQLGNIMKNNNNQKAEVYNIFNILGSKKVSLHDI